MTTFQLTRVPGTIAWRNEPLAWQVSPDQGLTITAGPDTDWFIDPAGQDATDSAPSALFLPPDRHFLWSARVRVAFASVFDAGVLVVYVHDALWAKLCFELSPQRHPMIVSVVTRGTARILHGGRQSHMGESDLSHRKRTVAITVAPPHAASATAARPTLPAPPATRTLKPATGPPA